MQIRFLGQACFEFAYGASRILVDPFLAPHNPVAPVSAEEVDPTHILLTHGHPDHAADAVAIARRTGAHCVAITDLGRWLGEQGVESVSDPNLGGTVRFDWGSVKLVPALHTNSSPDHSLPIGVAAGLVIEIDGVTIYHLGDTCLFGDMRLIGEREAPEIAIVPIGGHYTMDRADAAHACELIGARTVIPCHYDTFPKIEADVEAFRAEVESRSESEVVVLAPGEVHDR
ncbi:MAG: metal-dependent hydrolase [Solirubrobacterales bacterium]|nr:metal-dependent hydrolase [Solirubrobacterales bacterium]